jgi:hypothetical protein
MHRLERRVSRLEKEFGQRKKDSSKLSPDCICYPDLAPWVGFEVLSRIAFIVKCPLHGDRFLRNRDSTWICVAEWLRETQYRKILNGSACIFTGLPDWQGEKYRKAYLASFPPDLWPGEEEQEKQEEGPTIYLRLKDGTRIQVEQNHFSKPLWNDGDDPRNTDEEKERRVARDRARAELERAKDQIWEMETLRTAGRLLSQRGRIVDLRPFCANE